MKRFDLHTHSRHSDGTSTPGEIVARALAGNVEALFLTDHDSVAGFPEAQAAARGTKLDLRCGVEINTAYKDSVHILGYGIGWQDGRFLERLADFRARRLIRIQKMVEKLQAAGLNISFEDVRAGAGETLGRPHVADALKRKGLVRSRQEAFNRFLTKGKPGYVDPMGPSPEEAIALIRSAGGFCSLAHPDTVSNKEEDIAQWVAAGLEGLEVYYGAHSPSDIVRYQRLAERFGLLETGGSDYHGPGTGRDGALGVNVPDEVYGRFMERLSKCG